MGSFLNNQIQFTFIPSTPNYELITSIPGFSSESTLNVSMVLQVRGNSFLQNYPSQNVILNNQNKIS